MKNQTRSPRRRWLAVLGGGFLGALARYLLSSAMQAGFGTAWPYDILVRVGTETLTGERLFINVGFLGAYTTFSSLALGDVLLLGKAQWLAASAYLALSIPGGHHGAAG